MSDIEPPLPADAVISAPAEAGPLAPAPGPARPTGPRTRWAGIIWGLALATTAAVGLWGILDAGRRESVAEWVLGLTPVSLLAYALLVVGGLLVVAGIVGAASRTQRVLLKRRSPEPPARADTSVS